MQPPQGQQSNPVAAKPGSPSELPAKDKDPKSLKQNLAVATKDIMDFIKTADTANPSVVDLLQSYIDGLDAVFSKLSERFDALPESPDTGEDPDYTAEDAQGSENPVNKSVELGTVILAKALDFDIPSGTDIVLEPTQTSRWKTIATHFAEEVNKARTAISQNQRIVFYMNIGMCMSSLEELLAFVKPIMPEPEVKQWKKVMVELRANGPKAARSVKPGKNAANARAFIRKLSDCCAKLQERVQFQENNVNNLTKKMSILFGNRS
jgi:hypothetical protein